MIHIGLSERGKNCIIQTDVRMIRKLLQSFLVWRVLLFLPIIVASVVLPIRKGYEYTLAVYYLTSVNPIRHVLLSPWANFDGVYYLLIAAKGYTVNGGFFPLFPLGIRIVSSAFGTLLPFDPLQFAVATLLVNVCTFGSMILLYKVVRLDYPEKVAWRSAWMYLLFPTAFFLVSIYTESVFIFLVLSAFYFARRGRWVLAGVCGMMVTATRIVGIAIFPALVYEFILQHGGFSAFMSRLKNGSIGFIIRAAPIALIPLGLAGYLWYSLLKWGDAFYFIRAQGNMQNNRSVSAIVLLPQTLFRYAKILFTIAPSTYEWWIAVLEVLSCVFILWVGYVGWKERIRRSYLLYAVLAFLIPASTGTLTGLPRYALVLFPLFMVLGLPRMKRFVIYYRIISPILLGVLLSLYSRGYFVG